METAHRPLVRSSVLLAVASATLPVTLASADMTYFTDRASLETVAGDAGLSQMYVETFEENAIDFAYDILSPPLCSGVPDLGIFGGFPEGLAAPGLCIDTDDGASIGTLLPSAYWENITSAVTGTFSEFSRTIVRFENGMPAVGLVILGVDSFIANPPDEVQYRILDMQGAEVAAGVWPTPDSVNGSFFGVMSTDRIGAIELRGTSFTADVPEYVDDIEAWDVGGVEGDVTGDGAVTFEDLLLVLGAWGPCEGCPEDVTGDGNVNFEDVLVILANWS